MTTIYLADQNLEEWVNGLWSVINLSTVANKDDNDVDKEVCVLYWFDPCPNKMTFLLSTINYNSVLNVWSCASC